MRKGFWICCILGLCQSMFGQIFSSSHLPIVQIETQAPVPDEPKIRAHMRIHFKGSGQENHLNDPANQYDGYIGIETRGNSTQGFEKKTYAIETRSIQGQDSSVNLLGMGKEEDWILHAMVIDKSQLRIPMSFYLFRRMGHYAANWRYVELFLNGDYRGLYILTERIKRDDDRVDISKLKPEDIHGDELSGGYILRIDWLENWGDPFGFESAYESQAGIPMFYQYYYPSAEKITAPQAVFIKEFIHHFEQAIFSNNYHHPNGRHYTDFMDKQSFMDFLLINEFSKNSDGYKLSSYLHKDRDSKGGRLKAGPIWDFDQTYGLSTVCSSDDFSGWTFLQNQPNCEDLESMPMWWQALMQDSSFTQDLSARWKELRAGPFHVDSIFAWIDAHRNHIQAPVDRNFRRWEGFIGESIWIEPEPIPQSYAEEINYMKNWIRNRLNWLDANLTGATIRDLNEGPKIREDFLVYPNPSSGSLTIIADPGDQLTLFNQIGQVLFSMDLTEPETKLDLSMLGAGMYIIALDGYKHYEPQKIILLP